MENDLDNGITTFNLESPIQKLERLRSLLHEKEQIKGLQRDFLSYTENVPTYPIDETAVTTLTAIIKAKIGLILGYVNEAKKSSKNKFAHQHIINYWKDIAEAKLSAENAQQWLDEHGEERVIIKDRLVILQTEIDIFFKGHSNIKK